MPRIALDSGAYTSRSLIASAQRCVNLYPERNPEDAPSKFTHYLTPGLREISSPMRNEPIRALYTATNGVGYCVEGQQVYKINADWTREVVGSLRADRDNPVSMQDNGETLVIVDGSNTGFMLDLATQNYEQIVDAAFYGADRVGYIDTFLVFNRPGTKQFYSSPSNAVVPFDPLDIASKTGYPDVIATLAVVHREIWLIGAQATTEVWYDAGNADFPFAIVAGAFIQQGCIAKYSLAQNDLMLFWLGLDPEGLGTLFLASNYQVKRISTPAIANEWAKYPRLDDAIGMMYKQLDHIFYLITFPSANNGLGATWCYDTSEGLWHERAYFDVNGTPSRHRANCTAVINGIPVCGDYANGKLYAWDANLYTDDGAAIERRRGFPHVLNDGKVLSVDSFALDMEVGQQPLNVEQPAQVMLRWSYDRGYSWGDAIALSLGEHGDFLEQPNVTNLGMGRAFTAEVFWNANCATALQGAWLNYTPGSA